jgi:DNA polymerase III epsilon subunit-like protein
MKPYISLDIETTGLDPKLHERLVESGDWRIRAAIASNPNLDLKYFKKLLEYNDPIVHREIKNNPSYIKEKFDETLRKS